MMAQNPSSGAGSEQDCRPPRMTEGRWLRAPPCPREKRTETSDEPAIENAERGAFRRFPFVGNSPAPGRAWPRRARLAISTAAGRGGCQDKGASTVRLSALGTMSAGDWLAAGTSVLFPSSGEHGSHPTVRDLGLLSGRHAQGSTDDPFGTRQRQGAWGVAMAMRMARGCASS